MKRYNIEKIANAIILALDEGVNFLGKTKLMKLIFFADKEHIKRYGRPIFFEFYVKDNMGPVPLKTYSILSSVNDLENEDFKDEVESLLQWLEVEEKDVNRKFPMLTFKKKKEFDQSVFSKSEIEVLKDVFKKFKDYTAQQISEYSHKLPEYKNKLYWEEITYKDMAEEMKEFLEFWEEERKAFFKSITRK
ncbi:Panacea domain-containing protein [Hydrogenivirga sp. 128-5-R1-1]|uniref:Panacea domain-containing protein n=1 Tax=Hydrogenivirga sp. 128-5-R1-1 TaxID=392423 RepID=UPI00015EF031|nr:Panacea domain-containing protein [Hydrogenivirga sp. 128-5-R1-1]EDP73230.1 hypothetical protein HG1285_11927 [Hydrogenivirga sp. 128-5-R1-1]